TASARGQAPEAACAHRMAVSRVSPTIPKKGREQSARRRRRRRFKAATLLQPLDRCAEEAEMESGRCFSVGANQTLIPFALRGRLTSAPIPLLAPGATKAHDMILINPRRTSCIFPTRRPPAMARIEAELPARLPRQLREPVKDTALAEGSAIDP